MERKLWNSVVYIWMVAHDLKFGHSAHSACSVQLMMTKLAITQLLMVGSAFFLSESWKHAFCFFVQIIFMSWNLHTKKWDFLNGVHLLWSALLTTSDHLWKCYTTHFKALNIGCRLMYSLIIFELRKRHQDRFCDVIM